MILVISTSRLRGSDTVLGFPTDIEVYNRGYKVEAGNTDAIKINFREKEEDFIFIFQKKDAFSYIKEHGD